MKMHTLISLFVLSCFLAVLVNASKAACKDPYYGKCYGIPLACPPGCPKLCEIECKACKPYCACDKPGAVCQDPRFIGGDGVMFYFHGKKDKDFCLISDPKIHINAHFIGKKSKRGRDFTWVQAIALLYKQHKLFIGAKNVTHWHDTNDNMLMHFDGGDIQIPFSESREWRSTKAGIIVKRLAMTNVVEVEVLEVMKMKVRVVPITMEESRVHGYDISDDGNCFAHLELGFKFESLSGDVNGVLGQTYASGYRSRVKMGVAMPIMGGAKRFQTSNIFSNDCVVSRFGLEMSI